MKSLPALLLATLAACGSNYPEPKQATVETIAAVRGAEMAGASSDPNAALHLAYAKDEIAQARQLIADGANRRATFVLARAKSDADLAFVLSKASAEQKEAQRVQQDVDEMRSKLEGGEP